MGMRAAEDLTLARRAMRAVEDLTLARRAMRAAEDLTLARRAVGVAAQVTRTVTGVRRTQTITIRTGFTRRLLRDTTYHPITSIPFTSRPYTSRRSTCIRHRRYRHRHRRSITGRARLRRQLRRRRPHHNPRPPRGSSGTPCQPANCLNSIAANCAWRSRSWTKSPLCFPVIRKSAM